ncbi:T4S1 protein, partial [Glaucidium brasilianum]|nr:T4S1 protein [Glaucidium brasilianum]
PYLCRAAMCVGKCSRIVGPCLLALGTLSMTANILLLFPGGTWKYLVEGHISKHAKVLPGVWGGGIVVSTVVCAPRFGPSLTFGVPPALPGRCPQAFISAVLSKLAVLGAAACFVFSGLGLTDGPLCFYNASKHGHGHGTLWGYPFQDPSDQEPDARAESYLFDRRIWSICLEPKGIVVWNGILFFLLLLISAAEMVLASLQVLNGCLGCLCGYCEGK